MHLGEKLIAFCMFTIPFEERHSRHMSVWCVIFFIVTEIIICIRSLSSFLYLADRFFTLHVREMNNLLTT